MYAYVRYNILGLIRRWLSFPTASLVCHRPEVRGRDQRLLLTRVAKRCCRVFSSCDTGLAHVDRLSNRKPVLGTFDLLTFLVEGSRIMDKDNVGIK